MFPSRFDPGDRLDKRDIYEVWGEMVEYAAESGPAVISAIRQHLVAANVAEFFNCQTEQARLDSRPFLTVQWNTMVAHIDARGFGEHLDVYTILALLRSGTQALQAPDPAARLAELGPQQRRELQIFQSLLRQAVDEALEALDDGSLE